MARTRLEIAYDLAWIVEVAEHDGAGWAGILAGSGDRAGRHGAVVALGRAAGGADTLDAIGAFLHHPARPHRDLGVLLRLEGLRAEVAVFLAVSVAEEVEAAHLVGAVRLAKARTDAAVVDLDVQTLAVVDRGCDG